MVRLERRGNSSHRPKEFGSRISQEMPSRPRSKKHLAQTLTALYHLRFRTLWVTIVDNDGDAAPVWF